MVPGSSGAAVTADAAALLDRRGLLSWGARGLGATALLDLLGRDGLVRAEGVATHHIPRARRAVQITLIGGLSHIDSFDFKPELARHHGQSLRTEQTPDTFFGQIGLLRKNDWEFRRRGHSGLWVSDLFPHIATV